eukprot:s4182_g2.t3
MWSYWSLARGHLLYGGLHDILFPVIEWISLGATIAFALWGLRLRTKAKRSAWSRGMLLGVSSRARHPLRDVWIRLRLAPSRARVACTRPRPAVWKSSSTVVAVLPTCEGA